MVAHPPPHRSSSRPAAVTVAGTVGSGVLVRWLLPALTAPAHDLEDALVRVSAGAALLAAAWLWLGTVGLVLAAHGGRGEHAPEARMLPAPLRRIVLVACGVALSGSLAVTSAQGAPGQGDRLPVPDRATSTGAASYVVRPGDSLWSIAETTLPAGAADARVAGQWPRIYALNRDRIGPDPDLIRPAQRLALPRR